MSSDKQPTPSAFSPLRIVRSWVALSYLTLAAVAFGILIVTEAGQDGTNTNLGGAWIVILTLPWSLVPTPGDSISSIVLALGALINAGILSLIAPGRPRR